MLHIQLLPDNSGNLHVGYNNKVAKYIHKVFNSHQILPLDF